MPVPAEKMHLAHWHHCVCSIRAVSHRITLYYTYSFHIIWYHHAGDSAAYISERWYITISLLSHLCIFLSISTLIWYWQSDRENSGCCSYRASILNPQTACWKNWVWCIFLSRRGSLVFIYFTVEKLSWDAFPWLLSLLRDLHQQGSRGLMKGVPHVK